MLSRCNMRKARATTQPNLYVETKWTNQKSNEKKERKTVLQHLSKINLMPRPNPTSYSPAREAIFTRADIELEFPAAEIDNASSTNVRILSLCRIPRDPSPSETCLVTPFIGRLSLGNRYSQGIRLVIYRRSFEEDESRPTFQFQ